MYQYKYVSVRTNPGKGEIDESGRYQVGYAVTWKHTYYFVSSEMNQKIVTIWYCPVFVDEMWPDSRCSYDRSKVIREKNSLSDRHAQCRSNLLWKPKYPFWWKQVFSQSCVDFQVVYQHLQEDADGRVHRFGEWQANTESQQWAVPHRPGAGRARDLFVDLKAKQKKFSSGRCHLWFCCSRCNKAALCWQELVWATLTLRMAERSSTALCGSHWTKAILWNSGCGPSTTAA